MGILDQVKSPEQVRAEREAAELALAQFCRERLALRAQKHYDRIVEAVQREYRNHGTIERLGKQIVRADVWFTPADCMDCIFPVYHADKYAFLKNCLATLTDDAEQPRVETPCYTVEPDDSPISYTCIYHLLNLSEPHFSRRVGHSAVSYTYELSKLGHYALDDVSAMLDRDPAFTYRFYIGIEDGASEAERRREEALLPLAGRYSKGLMMAQAIAKFDYLRRPYVTPYLVARVAYEKK